MATAFERLFEVVECKTQIELAKFLGIRQSSISSAKKNGTVPSDWLLELLRKKRVNPEWIMEGKEPRYLQPDQIDEALRIQKQKNRPKRTLACWSSEELIIEMVKRFFKHLKAG